MELWAQQESRDQSFERSFYPVSYGKDQRKFLFRFCILHELFCAGRTSLGYANALHEQSYEESDAEAAEPCLRKAFEMKKSYYGGAGGHKSIANTMYRLARENRARGDRKIATGLFRDRGKGIWKTS